ncbi:uncharacterized protein LOC141617877 [Silene latifolia]|uniref:uncharacterized protein LOC141617877 n=1 Tax=Silene latifolia TaxID=37657 RepID=UPI003D788758
MKQVFLGSGHFLFDNKPLIIKPWQPDVELTKENVKTVPAWIRMQKLPLKFWGKSIPKISGLVGKYIKSDEPTELKTRLGFARVMVELNLGQYFPKQIKFRDEKQQLITIDTAYEWKPSLCTKCKLLGYEKDQCRKNKQQTKPSVPHKTASAATPVTKKDVEVVSVSTPVPNANVLSSGAISPVRQFKDTRKGSEHDDRTLSTSPLQMETLQENLSPKQSNEINETKVKSNNVHRIVNNIFSDWSVSTNNSKHPGGRVWPYDTRVYSRLDRFFVNQEWVDAFPHYMANFLPEGHFDHTPCLVSEGDNGGRQNRPFKYFNMWSSAPGFQECVNKAWSTRVLSTKMYKVVRKLKMLKPGLKLINRSHFSDIENNADIAFLKLTHIQKQLIDSPGDEGFIKQEHDAHQISISLQAAKLEYLKQKAKAHWIKDGDFNFAYFHGVIKARRNKNFICQIVDHHNKTHSDQEGIQTAFLDYYQMLLGTKASITKVKKAIVRKGKVCTDAHISALLDPISREEVKEVIFHIPDDKAPGPNGYSSKFFKDSWDIVGENQGGFIQGRSILENILICQNIIRLYERQAVSPRCLFKMDLQKAYDTIEWDFLDQMMTALNFPSQFKGWIMQCVITALTQS